MRCWTSVERCLRLCLAVASVLLAATCAQASELPQLRVYQHGVTLLMDAQVSLRMPAEMDSALRKGVPLVVVQEVRVVQPRWYWKDAVLAQTRREWTLSYQALTQRWRVMLRSGEQVEQFDELEAAWAFLTHMTRWPIGDLTLLGALQGAQAELLWFVDRRSPEVVGGATPTATSALQLSTQGRAPIPTTSAPVRDALSPAVREGN